MMDPILEIKNLCIDFKTNHGNIRACDDVSINFYRGDIIGIIGESGSGKSTLASGILKTISAPGKIANGEILYHKNDGNTIDLLKLSDQEYSKLRWTNITTVFQAAQNVLNPTLRIKDHFIETAMAHNEKRKLTKKQILDKSATLLRQVRLEERILDSYPHQLSGGMKQRTIIALSLLLEPDIIILDEPTTALDVITQWYIIDILKKIHEETRITMIFMTHDVSIIGSVVDRIGVMYCGQMVEYGKVEDVFKKPSHPYTYGLMNAVPSLRDDIASRKAIPGYPPNLLELPKGCRFGPRCFLCGDGICKSEEILVKEMFEIENEQLTLCPAWKKVKEKCL